VLVIEDDTALRESTRRLLERQGYRVVDAGNGAEALARWNALAEKPALVLTDLVMPGMTGHQVVAELRRLAPRLKVLFISGYSSVIAGKELELSGNDTFLQKPVPPQQLLETLRRCLDAS
jgi:CheY-like chemotaxis protein